MTSRQILDQVFSLAQFDAFEPQTFVDQLATELPDEIEPRNAQIAAALAQIDELTVRAMRVRLERIDMPAQTKKVFVYTIVSYANDLPLLASRAGDAVHEAGRAALALREALRAGVLALVREPEPEPEVREVTFADMIELD